MSQENVEAVRRLYESWNRGDYSAALDSMDPNIQVDVTDDRVDFAGTYRGHAGVNEMMGSFWREFEDPHARIEEAIPAGSHVVVAVRISGRGKRSGVEVEITLWQVWSFRDRKAVGWQIFPTKQEALEAAGLSE